LGWDCLILAFFFAWHLSMTLRLQKSRARRNELVFCLGFIGMIWWLFSMADSKTPLVALLSALVIFFLTGFKWVDKRFVGIYISVAVIVIVAAEATFGIYDVVLELLGRDPTLTERTLLWAELLKWPINPILGTGFESFWLGDRRETIWELLKWEASEAHNGYLETYLSLGVLGLLFLFRLVASTYKKAHLALQKDVVLGRFRYAFFFAILIYNWTESSFGGLHPVWFMFFIVTMDYPKGALAERFHRSGHSHRESNREFAYCEA
jgi:O-antigen ligase